MIRPIASIVGWPMERLRGVTGRLARENTLRNPGRTTTTAAALMIGLALVAFVATFASALSKSFDQALDEQFAGDLILVNTDGFSRIPGGVVESVEKVPGVAVASPLASADARIEGIGKEVVSAIDPATVGRVANLDWDDGSDATLRRLGATGIDRRVAVRGGQRSLGRRPADRDDAGRQTRRVHDSWHRARRAGADRRDDRDPDRDLQARLPVESERRRADRLRPRRELRRGAGSR